jgi:heat-inducible transcriptional repressor
MTARHRRILASLVAGYIEQGEPVSSAWLADRCDLGLSSATVRNILALLEEQGLVRQPHTSAGRIHDSGYRYVDTLLEPRRGRERDVEARSGRSPWEACSKCLTRALAGVATVGFASAGESEPGSITTSRFWKAPRPVITSNGRPRHPQGDRDRRGSHCAHSGQLHHHRVRRTDASEAREAIVGVPRERLRTTPDAAGLSLAQKASPSRTPERLHVQGVVPDRRTGHAADREGCQLCACSSG